MTATDWFLLGAIVLVAVSAVLAIVAERIHLPWLASPGVVVIAALIATGAVRSSTGIGGLAQSPLLGIALIVVVAVLGVAAGSPLVALVLGFAGADVTRQGAHGGILVTGRNDQLPAREVLRGGATIGHLERLALVGSILSGQYGAVAVIVAIKGLGRFSELENSAARERFIIGTLASLAWAAAAGWAAVLWY